MRRSTIVTFEGLFNDFIKNCKVRNLSPATIKFYTESYGILKNPKKIFY